MLYLGVQSWYDHKMVVHFGAEAIIVHHQTHLAGGLIHENQMENFFVVGFHGTQGDVVVQ